MNRRGSLGPLIEVPGYSTFHPRKCRYCACVLRNEWIRSAHEIRFHVSDHAELTIVEIFRLNDTQLKNPNA